MQAQHVYKRISVKNTVDNTSSFLLTNGQGGYAWFGPQSRTRYQGLHFGGTDAIKTVDFIGLLSGAPIQKVVNHFSHVQFERKGITEQYAYLQGTNTLHYKLTKKDSVELVLDCRKIFDNRSFGRYYEMYKEDNKIIIEFQKKNDGQEGDGEEYTIYLAISTDADKLDTLAMWGHYFYEDDHGRESQPHERFRYHALKLFCSELIITQGFSKEEVIKENDHVTQNLKSYQKAQLALVDFRFASLIKTKTFKRIKNKEVQVAYLNAVNQFYGLMQDKGIFAGYPWFMQYWSRDELICLKAAMLLENFDLVKEVLDGKLKGIQKDGRLPNRVPSADLGNADGIGFLFQRYQEFITLLKKRGIVSEYYTNQKLRANAKVLKNSLNQLFASHGADGLIRNDHLETWMDTEFAGDSRDGERIEIQAYTLNALRVAYLESQDKKIKKMENDLWSHTILNFWTHLILKDGKYDETQRPNIYLAYYSYPSLLSLDEWTTAIDMNLRELWRNWGGLSSIANSSPLFHPLYTGENNKSYHRGDSWYWINNLAAICLHRVDDERYHNYIQELLQGSVKDLLWQGILGHGSELSSALDQQPQGCLSQAWSAALFIELIHELYAIEVD